MFLSGQARQLRDLGEGVEVGSDPTMVLERLRAIRPDVIVTAWSTPDLGPVLTAPDTSVRYVCHLTGSVRKAVPRRFLERGGKVTNWGSLVGAAVAEHALLLALAGLRNLGAWQKVITGEPRELATRALGTRTLFGRRVGLHGFGAVAQALVGLLRPFGVPVRAYSPMVPPDVMRARDVNPAESLQVLFAESDVLFECEALTPENRGCVGAAELAALPDGAVFVNVARGELVDEVALLREAATGRIRLALDVVAAEPLTAASPLAAVPGAVLSPHIGGPTLDLYPRVGAFALDNIERFRRGQPLHGEVGFAVYDRST